MSWLITGKGAPLYDPDAAAYIAAVEAADQQTLEDSVKYTIDQFVRGCKADGIWNAIKASCILAGARTLNGALVPLVGTAPTNFNFVPGDYNRKTGLVGDGSTKYLNSNRNNNADPQNSHHQSVWVSAAPTITGAQSYIGAGAASTGSTQITNSSSAPFQLQYRNRSSTVSLGSTATILSTQLIATSRSSAVNFTARGDGLNETFVNTSELPHNGNLLVFARNSGTNTAGLFLTARLAFYSIGEALDLEKLDNRVTALINAFGTAIP